MYIKKTQLSFSLKIEIPQLGFAWRGTFTARLGSSQKIPARTHQVSTQELSTYYVGELFWSAFR